MDSYFASIEQQANPDLQGKPIGITGGDRLTRTVLAAASKEAKLLGVKTGMRIFEAKSICPDLITVCGDSYKYLEISQILFKIFKKYSPLMEIFSIDEVFIDVTKTKHLFKNELNIISLIKKEIRNTLGSIITCSVGVSHNKLLAKLASSVKKPDGIYKIEKNHLPQILDNFSLDDLCGIGPKIKKRLETLGIFTFSQLRKTPYKLSKMNLVFFMLIF